MNAAYKKAIEKRRIKIMNLDNYPDVRSDENGEMIDVRGEHGDPRIYDFTNKTENAVNRDDLDTTVDLSPDDTGKVSQDIDRDLSKRMKKRK